MKNFKIYFKMIDHYLDDAGYNMPIECTIVEAESTVDAIKSFCGCMFGEQFEIIETLELS